MKRLKLHQYQLIEIIWCLLLLVVSIICNAISTETFMKFSSMFMIYGYEALLVFTIVEMFLYKKKPAVQMTLLIIGSITNLLLLFDKTPPEENEMTNPELVGILCVIMVLIHLLILLIIYFINSKKYQNSGSSSMMININKVKEHHYIPVGFLSRKDAMIFYVEAGFVIALIVGFVVGFSLINMMWLGILLGFVSGVILLVLVNIKGQKKMLKPFIKYESDLDINSLDSIIQECLKRDLHPETKNMIMAIMSNYYLDYDMEKHEEYFKEVFMTSNPKCKLTVDTVLLNELINSKDYEAYEKKYSELINDPFYKKNKQFNKILHKINDKYEAAYKGIMNSPIDICLPLNTKNNLENIGNCYLRANYYATIKDEKKLEEMKEYYNKHAQNMTLSVERINQLTIQ